MDTLAVELIIDDQKATVKLDNFGQKIKLVSDDINKVGGDTRFAGKLTTDLDALSKRADATYLSFKNIASTRLDAGNIGHLTREILSAQTRAQTLASDIVNIRRELANPNRKSSIAFLTSELKGAEKEADALNRKLDLVNARNSANPTSGRAGGGRRRGISQGQAAFLEVIDDFAPVGLNRPFNAIARELLTYNNAALARTAAKTASTVATTAETTAIGAATTATAANTVATTANATAAGGATVAVEAETAAFAGLGLASFGLFAGVAAIGAVVITQSKQIRDEAERHLKIQEQIVGAVNRQILGQQQALKDFQKLRENAAFDRQFSRDLQSGSTDELEQRRATVEKLLSLTPQSVNDKPNENFQRLQNEIAALDKQIEQIPLDKQKQANEAFNQRFERFKKLQESSLETDKRLEAANKKRDEDIEKAKLKVKDLEKTYLSTFNSLFQKTGAENPFVQLFTEANKSLRELKENIKGLPQDQQAVALKMQQQFNLKKLLETGVDNKLSVFDLREQANSFRNPFDGDRQKKDQDEFVTRFLQNNPNYLFLQNKKSLDDDERQKILKRFAPSALNETPADRLNKSLDDKFNLLYQPGQTGDQLAIADKRFISATAGANPLDLNKTERERAAVAREREAIRQERFQQDAIALYRQQLETQNRIAENTGNKNKLAEKGGTKAIELTLKDETTGGTNSQLQPAATSRDTSRAYFDPDLSLINNHGTLTNR